MCRTCRDAKKNPDKKAALKSIGDAMTKGKNPEHFKETLDELLGTKEPEQDADLDAAWERSHRPQ